jgi:2-polyprenyl-3-methyl-5-hydroxy-6-metoxy-1,4-benzoquinol methylase
MATIKNSNDEDVRKTWRALWARPENKKVVFNSMSKAILAQLLRNFGTTDLKGIKILKSGSGGGVISAELAALGAEVYLLDISVDALEVSRAYFRKRGLRANYIQGDLHKLPFNRTSFDVVWNAGVLEHFLGDSRSMAVKGLGQLVKPKGFFISLNPSEDACFYMIGKEAAERTGKWPFGPEFPVKSLKDECKAATGLEVVTEYSICFRESLFFLTYYSKWLKRALKLILLPFPERLMLKVFGGYLLITVARKK